MLPGRWGSLVAYNKRENTIQNLREMQCSCQKNRGDDLQARRMGARLLADSQYVQPESSALFWGKAPGQGVRRSQRRDSSAAAPPALGSDRAVGVFAVR
jgi:hypothetical protein